VDRALNPDGGTLGSSALLLVQRKALTPNDFGSLDELAQRLTSFGEYYRQLAQPFEWTFTRQDLNRVLNKIADREPHPRLAA
jgi:hypothetical protein